MGTTQVQIPLPLGTVKELKDTCPKPKKDPKQAVNFLKRYCDGSRMSEEDLYIIINAVDPESTAEIDVPTWATESELYKTGEDWSKFWEKLLSAW